MSFPLRSPSIPRLLIATAAALLGLVAFTSAAQACSYPDAEQVFSRWGDNAYYELAPEGDLEGESTGWTFLGGAQLVSGNEDQFLNSPNDSTSLSIPFGGTAISPKVCVDDSTPAFRLMALNGGDDHSKLHVTVAYELPGGIKTKAADVRADGTWEPTEPLKLDINSSEERAARIAFTPKDTAGVWQIDDLYVDPFSRR